MVMVHSHYNAHIGNGGGLLFLSENVPFKDMISNHTNKFSMTQWLIFQNNILWIYVKPMWLDKCLVMISRRVTTNLCKKKTSNNADVSPQEVDCTLLIPAVFLQSPCLQPPISLYIMVRCHLWSPGQWVYQIQSFQLKIFIRVVSSVYINRMWRL